MCQVSPKAGTGEIQDSSFLFLCLSLPFFIPKSCFPSLLLISRVAAALLACLHLFSSLPVCNLSPRSVNPWLGDDQDKVHEPTSHLRKTLRSRFVSRVNFCSSAMDIKQTRRKPEFSPYLGAALSCLKPFTRG